MQEAINLNFDKFEDPLLMRDRLIRQAKHQVTQSEISEAFKSLGDLMYATIDEKTLDETDEILKNHILHNYQLIATCDPNRSAHNNEHVIIYGNYPHYFDNLLLNKVSRRHVSWFWKLKHDRVESHHSWDPIDQIFIINKDSRIDRFDAILNELARARAPFDRITRISAITPEDDGKNTAFIGTAGCLMSHIETLQCATALGKKNFLVLEDDFTFTNDIALHLCNLKTFFSREYDYWICLLATSKYGLIVQKDDLLSYTLQPCTNAAGYLISQSGIEQLLPVWKSALSRMNKTLDYQNNAADRCWAVLQKSGKFLVFRNKMGFQASSYSNIESNIARYFD